MQIFNCYTLLVLAAIILLCGAHDQLQLVHFREGNSILMVCRTADLVPLNGAMFWKSCSMGQNIQELEACTNVIASHSDGNFRFDISRDREGLYRCGKDGYNSSEWVKLIAHPDSRILPSNLTTFYSEVGCTARIDCSVLPGVHVEQYTAYWDYHGVRTREPKPRNALRDTRVTVDNETLSLLIHNVTLNDTGRYRCTLAVRDPGGQEFIYHQTEDIDLNLIVYQAPVILKSPKKKVIALGKSKPNYERAEFQCEATGAPLRQIKWQHKYADNSSKYSVSTSFQFDEFKVTSTLTIYNVDPTDSGEVNCTVEADDDELPVKFQPVSASAPFVVLGGINDLHLLVNENGGILFFLQLSYTLLVPINLTIIYVSSNERVEYLTNSTYNNTCEITYVEQSDRVPFRQSSFLVMVALQHDDTQGPKSTIILRYMYRSTTDMHSNAKSAKGEAAMVPVLMAIMTVCAFISMNLLVAIALCLCLVKHHLRQQNHEQKA